MTSALRTGNLRRYSKYKRVFKGITSQKYQIPERHKSTEPWGKVDFLFA